MSNKGDMMQTFEPDQLVLVRENDTQEGRASPPSTSLLTWHFRAPRLS